MNRKIFAAVAAMVAALSAPCDAQIYKWTDSSGKTVFGDKPPSSAGKTVSSVDTKTASQEPTTKNNDWAEKDRDFRVRLAQRQADAIKATPPASNSALMSCGEAKANQRELDRIQGKHAYRRDAKGERVWITDDERANIQSRTQESIGKNCR